MEKLDKCPSDLSDFIVRAKIEMIRSEVDENHIKLGVLTSLGRKPRKNERLSIDGRWLMNNDDDGSLEKEKML